jgi:outer membrane protein TolC
MLIKSRLFQMSTVFGPIGFAMLLSACKTFSPDGGMGTVTGIVQTELRQTVTVLRTPQETAQAQAKVEQLLKRPLTADRAVQIALLSNRGLQVAYNELGLAEAAMVQASLPPNPTFTLERLTGPVEIELEKRIIANILALATLPARTRIAETRFHQAQLRAAEETLRVAAEARRAFYRAVAGRERTGLLTEAKSAAETATKLAKRLGETGAMNKLDQAREQLFYAELIAQLATLRQRTAGDRERLVRVMGLWGRDLAFTLPDRLPVMPKRPMQLPRVESDAVRRRIDLRIARLELDALARSYGLSQATRFINLLEVAGISKVLKDRETGESTRDLGFELEIQIPIFDGGEVRVRQAELSYQRAVNLLIDKAVNARSHARNAYRAYRSTYDVAMHFQREVVPLRTVISEEMLLQYNAMQIDVFRLLAEARQRIATSTAAIEAQREFWLASVDLAVAMIGGGASTDMNEGSTSVAAASGGDAGH